MAANETFHPKHGAAHAQANGVSAGESREKSTGRLSQGQEEKKKEAQRKHEAKKKRPNGGNNEMRKAPSKETWDWTEKGAWGTEGGCPLKCLKGRN